MQPLIVMAEHGEALRHAGAQDLSRGHWKTWPGRPRQVRRITEPSHERISPHAGPKAVSLFSGCGGSDAGLISAGFDIILANDIAAYARDLYQVNLPETDFQFKDIRKIGHPESGPARRLLPLPGVQPRRGTAIRPESKLPVPGVR